MAHYLLKKRIQLQMQQRNPPEENRPLKKVPFQQENCEVFVPETPTISKQSVIIDTQKNVQTAANKLLKVPNFNPIHTTISHTNSVESSNWKNSPVAQGGERPINCANSFVRSESGNFESAPYSLPVQTSVTSSGRSQTDNVSVSISLWEDTRVTSVAQSALDYSSETTTTTCSTSSAQKTPDRLRDTSRQHISNNYLDTSGNLRVSKNCVSKSNNLPASPNCAGQDHQVLKEFLPSSAVQETEEKAELVTKILTVLHDNIHSPGLGLQNMNKKDLSECFSLLSRHSGQVGSHSLQEMMKSPRVDLPRLDEALSEAMMTPERHHLRPPASRPEHLLPPATRAPHTEHTASRGGYNHPEYVRAPPGKGHQHHLHIQSPFTDGMAKSPDIPASAAPHAPGMTQGLPLSQTQHHHGYQHSDLHHGNNYPGSTNHHGNQPFISSTKLEGCQGNIMRAQKPEQDFPKMGVPNHELVRRHSYSTAGGHVKTDFDKVSKNVTNVSPSRELKGMPSYGFVQENFTSECDEIWEAKRRHSLDSSKLQQDHEHARGKKEKSTDCDSA